MAKSLVRVDVRVVAVHTSKASAITFQIQEKRRLVSSLHRAIQRYRWAAKWQVSLVVL